jgi:hypothetical protein
MRALLDELLAAARVFARAPAFTALAVGVLGLGLGAVIFMYGVADTLMMKPPPYPNADRLSVIVTIDGQTPGDYDDNMLPLDYLKVREAATQFEAMGAVYVGTAYLTGDGQAERYDGGFADGTCSMSPASRPSSAARSCRRIRSKARHRSSCSATRCGWSASVPIPRSSGARCG